MPDSKEYVEYMKRKELEWESLCHRCGACCGAYADPCEHLMQGTDGKWYCDTYEDRYGLHSSKGGLRFKCVPIRSILNRHWDSDHLCAYKIAARTPWIEK